MTEKCVMKKKKEEKFLFNDTLNTFYSWLYVGHMVNDHSDSKTGNPPPNGLISLISSKGCLICTIPQIG